MENNGFKKVKIAPRKRIRDLKNQLGTDIVRYLVEVITNSDDSYRRLESSGEVIDSSKIRIELSKSKDEYMFTITDNAEGMTKDQLDKIFETYAGDNAGGASKHARGIFGQGAADVLKSAANDKKKAFIISFKGNEVSKLTYMCDETTEGLIKAEPLNHLSKQKINQLRNKYGIRENGTAFCFGVPSTVKFKPKQINELPEKISRCPYLRYMLNNKKRNIEYIDLDGNATLLSSNKYSFNDNDKISTNNFFIQYDETKLKCELTLYYNSNKKENETNIIVRDENYNVYDNTMFDFKYYTSAQNISGELVINGLYAVCQKELNEKHDTIVLDNRTGLNTKHVFYDILDKEINPIIKQTLDSTSQSHQTINLSSDKKVLEALKELNKYFAEEMDYPVGGGSSGRFPPEEGIKFARDIITITQGKRYSLKLYINAKMITQGEEITIETENNDNIFLLTNSVTFSIKDVDDNFLVVKDVLIQANKVTETPVRIVAKSGMMETFAVISVIEEDIYYPNNGLEFYPNDVVLVKDRKHKLQLYVDSTVIPFNSNILITCNGLNLKNERYLFTEAQLITKEIGKIDIELDGGEVDSQYIVVANNGNYYANAKITICENHINTKGNGGFITDFSLESSDLEYQVCFNEENHKIQINSKNPINIRMMKGIQDLNPDKPKFNEDQYKYLCDIVSQQAATTKVRKTSVKNGDVNLENFDDAVEKIQLLIQKEKNIIYVRLYKCLIGKEAGTGIN